MDGIHPDDRFHTQEALRAGAKARQPFEVEYRLRRPDGQYRWLVDRGVPRLARDGGFAGFIGAASDIDDRKRAEQELSLLLSRESVAHAKAERAEERATSLAQASRVFAESLDSEVTLQNLARVVVPTLADLCVIDLLEHGVIRRVAAAHADPAKESIVDDLQRRFSPDPGGRHPVARVLRTGRSEMVSEITDEILDQIAQHPDHRDIAQVLHYTSYIVVPLVARGRTLGAISLVSGESERRYGAQDLALAEELAQRAAWAVDNARLFAEEQSARREAEAASRMKDEFLATLSHELRTPLNAMMGWTMMLRDGKLDASLVRRALESVERNVRLQARLIEDLLDVSRIVTGKFQLDVRPLELPSVIEAAGEGVRPAATAKGITLDIALDRSAGPVLGDPARLQQVVWNLLSNAVKFTPAGGRIEVQLTRAGGQAAIRVTDTGIGIDPTFLPHIFERFLQADSSTTRRYGGLGLGLAIVRHIVEMHGGTVQAESPGEGAGARFTVLLPRATSSSALGIGRPAAAGEPQELGGLRVLVVDDDPDTLDLVRTILTAAGASVRTATNVAETLDALQTWTPSLLLADIGLPGEDGHVLIEKVRRLDAERGGGVPAVALSAYARHEDRERALAAGYRAHLAKPVEPAELRRTVRLFAVKSR
jgi:signal transduction histidine kinase